MKTSKLQRLPRQRLPGLSAGMILITTVLAGPIPAQYPPPSEYLMPRDAEIALARSAAPANISDRATIKVLTKSGYEVAHKGDNGFVCMVMRGWAAPTYTPAQFRNLVYDASVGRRRNTVYCDRYPCGSQPGYQSSGQVSLSPKSQTLERRKEESNEMVLQTPR